MDNQDFFAAAHGRGAPCRWELSVKEVNQATKRPTESGSSSSTTSTIPLLGEPQGASVSLQGSSRGAGAGAWVGWLAHQSCWTKRNTVELDMTNPRLAEWPKSDSQIAL